jgi:predicted nucleic acid-binding protein
VTRRPMRHASEVSIAFERDSTSVPAGGGGGIAMSSTSADTTLVFVDTNILVYAHDATAGTKREQARALLVELWESGTGCLSVQVLQEFFVVVTTKVPRPLEADTAAAVIADLARWHVHAPAPNDLLAAIGIHSRTGLSFWDAMIVRSATALGCSELRTEDLSEGQILEGVRVVNPFR